MPVDFAAARKSLAEHGVAIGGYYAAETFGNPTGGFKQGATYDGVLELHLNADMRKLGLWKGLCFYTDAFQIHGRSITADYVHSLVTVSNLEATPATKLYELWLEQSLFNKHLSVRVGQLAADGDFFVLEGVDDWFLDGSWGWPSLIRCRSAKWRTLISTGDSRDQGPVHSRGKLRPQDRSLQRRTGRP